MKPELSEILIPSKDKQPQPQQCIITTIPRQNSNTSTSCLSKCFIGFVLVFIIATVGVLTGTIVRYEGKLSDYENRISLLEEELTIFFEHFEARGASRSEDDDDDVLFDDLGENDDDEDSLEDHIVKYFENKDEKKKSGEIWAERSEAEIDKDDSGNEETRFVFGEIKQRKEKPEGKIVSRSKRQALFQQVPTFGPYVRRSDDGVPILEGAYGGSSTNHGTGNRNYGFQNVGPTDSEGLRLYESLIETRGRGEPKSDQFEESHGTNIMPYHRQSASWSAKDEQRSRLQLKSGDTDIADDDLYYRQRSRTSSGNIKNQSSTLDNRRRHTIREQQSAESGAYTSPTQAQPNVFVRTSRVSATNDQIYEINPRTREYNYPPLQRLGRGEGEVIARVHQERYIERPSQVQNGQSPVVTQNPVIDHGVSSGANQGESASSFAESRRYKGGYSRQRTGETSDTNNVRHQRRQRNNTPSNLAESESDEFSFVKAEAWAESPKTYAAHYVADVSNYTMAHRHYEGNGRLKNANGTFQAWKPSNWMAANEAAKEAFSLSPNGILNIRKEGLYYIYAQIHYLDDHDINGYQVFVNTEPLLQCTSMTETRSVSKSNTCFTAGIAYLKETDRVFLRDIETNRYSIFKPEKSFFGLMRIGNAGGR